jgi:hypothetical protein
MSANKNIIPAWPYIAQTGSGRLPQQAAAAIAGNGVADFFGHGEANPQPITAVLTAVGDDSTGGGRFFLVIDPPEILIFSQPILFFQQKSTFAHKIKATNRGLIRSVSFYPSAACALTPRDHPDFASCLKIRVPAYVCGFWADKSFSYPSPLWRASPAASAKTGDINVLYGNAPSLSSKNGESQNKPKLENYKKDGSNFVVEGFEKIRTS